MVERKVDRNRAARQPFLANAIVTEAETNKQIAGLVRNLSLFGCYVETSDPLREGVTAQLSIIHNEQNFTVTGRIAHATANKGMGITFIFMMSEDRAILEQWMAELQGPDQRDAK